ncbi:MAG: glycosyltransferase family 39 protein [Anaerolineae bacterium]|uniref:ArnT family glycosyltransferase n=1 Tax=Candidatus Amarolinea dominans TaxID=3140696 RepID=UPI0031356283|nr:glycosyltransferase family 39 protein [Anaerolineae bacterium]
MAIHTEREAFPYQGTTLAVRLIRVLSSLFGLLGLIAVYLTGRLIFQPGPSPLPALMMAVVGFVPTYTFAASVINNDILVGALGLWCIYFCALSVRSGVRIRSFALATICMALAFLTKYNGVILLPIVTLTGVVLLVRSWRAGNARLNRSLRALGLIIAIQTLLPSWWLLRNKQLYGDYFINYPNMIQPFTTKISWLGAFTVPELVTRLTNGVKFTFMTFWGLLGADFVVLPEWLLNLLAILTGLVVVGIIYQRRVRRESWRALKTTPNNYVVGVHLMAADKTCFGGARICREGNFATSLWQPGDIFRDRYRFYLQAAPPGTLPIAGQVKISMYCPNVNSQPDIPVLDAAGNVQGDAVYSTPIRIGLSAPNPPPQGDDPPLARFGDEIALQQVTGLPLGLHLGAELALDFTWQALAHPRADYTSICISSTVREFPGQADKSLTQERYPSGMWLAGETINDTPRLSIPVATLPSGTYQLTAGLARSGHAGAAAAVRRRAAQRTRMDSCPEPGNSPSTRVHADGHHLPSRQAGQVGDSRQAGDESRFGAPTTQPGGLRYGSDSISRRC